MPYDIKLNIEKKANEKNDEKISKSVDNLY